jgi:hypothetical protein
VSSFIQEWAHISGAPYSDCTVSSFIQEWAHISGAPYSDCTVSSFIQEWAHISGAPYSDCTVSCFVNAHPDPPDFCSAVVGQQKLAKSLADRGIRVKTNTYYFLGLLRVSLCINPLLFVVCCNLFMYY